MDPQVSQFSQRDRSPGSGDRVHHHPRRPPPSSTRRERLWPPSTRRSSPSPWATRTPSPWTPTSRETPCPSPRARPSWWMRPRRSARGRIAVFGGTHLSDRDYTDSDEGSHQTPRYNPAHPRLALPTPAGRGRGRDRRGRGRRRHERGPPQPGGGRPGTPQGTRRRGSHPPPAAATRSSGNGSVAARPSELSSEAAIADPRPVLFRFCLYGFLKNQQYWAPFLLLAFRAKGLSFTAIGLLLAIRALVTNLLEIPSGALADLHGRRRAMLLSFSAYLLSFVLLGSARSFLLLAGAMACFGVGDAFRSGTHKAMIMRWLEGQGRRAEKTKIYGLTPLMVPPRLGPLRPRRGGTGLPKRRLHLHLLVVHPPLSARADQLPGLPPRARRSGDDRRPPRAAPGPLDLHGGTGRRDRPDAETPARPGREHARRRLPRCEQGLPAAPAENGGPRPPPGIGPAPRLPLRPSRGTHLLPLPPPREPGLAQRPPSLPGRRGDGAPCHTALAPARRTSRPSPRRLPPRRAVAPHPSLRDPGHPPESLASLPGRTDSGPRRPGGRSTVLSVEAQGKALATMVLAPLVGFAVDHLGLVAVAQMGLALSVLPLLGLARHAWTWVYWRGNPPGGQSTS